MPDDPDPIDPRTAAVTATPAERVALALLRRAMRERRVVRLWYRGSADQAATERVVRPYAAAYATGAWYLVAYCERSAGLRVFRLDRMEAHALGEAGFEMPADVSLDEVVRDGRVFHGAPAQVVTVRYGPAVARWIAERERRPLAADGSLTLEHPLADMRWLVRHVLQYGADAEVLGPPEARAAVRAALEALE
jgi:predicted DNA-binding transcriptional regulator YafY